MAANKTPAKKPAAKKRAPRKPKAPEAVAAAPESTAETGRPMPPVETRWKPGQSGNPGGIPKAIVEVKRAARAHTAEAIERLAYWMRSENPKASVSATVALINRGWGMPTQNVNTTVRNLKQMTDAELIEYLTGAADEGASGEGAAETAVH